MLRRIVSRNFSIGAGAATIAQSAYLGHHLGLGDAVKFMKGGLDPARAKMLLGAQIGAAQAGRHIAAAGDATAVERSLEGEVPLVVVNPPRRGLGVELAQRLEDSQVRSLIYSSCNARTLARDLAAMPSWRPVQARLLDMFPHTGHSETAVLLQRR